MAAGVYVGISGVARKVKAQYVGVSGTARKVTKGYVGVSGVARKAWEENLPSFSCTLTASFYTRFGGSYDASCSLTFTWNNGEYAAQGTISLQDYTAYCGQIRVTGVPANVQQEYNNMVVNGAANLSRTGSEYVGDGGAAISVSGSSASISAVLAVGSGSGPSTGPA